MAEMNDERYETAMQHYREAELLAVTTEAETIASRLLRRMPPKPLGLEFWLGMDITLRYSCRLTTVTHENDAYAEVFLQTIHDRLNGSDIYPNGFRLLIEKIYPERRLKNELRFRIITPPKFKEKS